MSDQRTQHYGPDVLQRLAEDAGDDLTDLRRIYPWAADKIERLRAEADLKLDWVSADRHAAMRADRDRLRAALGDCVATLEACRGALPDWSAMQRYVADSLSLARAALAGTIGDTNADTGADRAPEPASAGRTISEAELAHAVDVLDLDVELGEWAASVAELICDQVEIDRAADQPGEGR